MGRIIHALLLVVCPAGCDLCCDDPEIESCDTGCEADADTDADADSDADSDADTDTGPLVDTDTVCETTDPEVPGGFSAPEGWFLELFAEGFELPGAVRAPADGAIYLGAGQGTWDARAVHRIQPDGSVDASDEISDPDGIAVDPTGAVLAAGRDDIVLVGSLDGGSDSFWHTLSTGGNINGLVIDTAHDDTVWVPLDEGDVVRVEQDRTETLVETGSDEGALALDDEGDVWMVRRNEGELLRIDRGSLEVEQVVALTDLEPDLARTNRIVAGPDGWLYMTSYVTDQGASVRRIDPAQPDALEAWMTGLEAEDNDPDDLDFSEADGCLYWSAPLTGRVWRACPCG